MDLWSTTSRQPRNAVVDPQTQGNSPDLAAQLLSIATYTTGTREMPQQSHIQLKVRVDLSAAGVRSEVAASLERSLKENAEIWAELSKY